MSLFLLSIWSILLAGLVRGVILSRMFQKVPECMQKVPECSRMYAECLELLLLVKNEENETQFFLFCLYTALKLFHFFGFDV